jgi:pyruvate dehydrogenase E2 component (dihydrolipoamide acetyltransferase)
MTVSAKARKIVFHYLLEDHARRHPDKPLLLMGDRTMSYGEVDRAANRIGRGFAAAGVVKGDRVLVMLPSCVDYVLVWLGLSKIGALMVPVNEAYKAGMLRHQANNSGAKLAVVWRAHLPVWLDIGETLSELKTVIIYEGGDSHPHLASPLKGEGHESEALPLEGGGLGGGESSPKPALNGHAKAPRIIATPLARRLAKQGGIDLSAIAGSGPHGRIVKADLDKVPKATPAQAPAATPPTKGQDAKQLADLLGMKYEARPNSSFRKTIARRLTEAKQTVPHFYLTLDCRIDALLDLRKKLNASAGEGGPIPGVKVSVNDFVIRASALALRKIPDANVSWSDDAILAYQDVDISIAVATPNGLITPIIKQADTKSLRQIAAEMKDLAARARDGKLKPQEYQGGTFSISNLGMFGIREFAAVINPPQSCILAVGSGEQRAVVEDGALKIATLMTVTLSVDHRAVDGAMGAEYLGAFKALMEDPYSLLL